MSAYHNNDFNNWLQTTGMSFSAAVGNVLIGIWTKREDVDVTNDSVAFELSQSAAGDTFPLVRNIQQRGARVAIVNNMGITENSQGAITTWLHRAIWIGPLDGTPNTPIVHYNNGANAGTSTITYDAGSVNFTTLRVFRRLGGVAASGWRGRLAEIAIYANITTGQRDTIIAEMQTRHVGALSITPNHAWRLLSDPTAAAGSANLAATGTITYDENDHPPVDAAVAARRRLVWVG